LSGHRSFEGLDIPSAAFSYENTYKIASPWLDCDWQPLRWGNKRIKWLLCAKAVGYDFERFTKAEVL